jgi:hypothetical protein
MSSVDHLVQSLLRPVRRAIAPAMGWLSRVPIDDPIDRRNAPTMQLLFLVFGTTLPISWARHLTAFEVPPVGCWSAPWTWSQRRWRSVAW